MAFFSTDDEHYFSLSLNPTKPKKTFVFKVTPLQMRVVSIVIPLSLVVSVLSFVAIIAALMLNNRLISTTSFSSDGATTFVVATASAAAVSAFAELVLFIWVRSTPSSLLDERSRHMLHDTQISKALSCVTYLAFLTAILVPYIGIFALPVEGSSISQDLASSGLVGRILIFQLLALSLLFVLFLVRRIVLILRTSSAYV